MRRLSLVLLLGAMVAIGSGCIGVSANDNRQFRSDDRDTVVLNGKLYVVEKSSGRVMKLDVDKAEPFVKATYCEEE